MNQRAVFLDLNGTLVLPIKPDSLNDLTSIEGAGQAIARLSRAGFLCPVVTVQSRIAKGVFSAQEFHHWFDGFSAGLRICGAELVGPYVCPHRFTEPCACKKPSTLLYEQADVSAASRFGGQGCLVRTGWADDPGELKRAAPYTSFVAESLREAVNWILSRPNGPS
jgi:histidinol phosphatase-like enzyme